MAPTALGQTFSPIDLASGIFKRGPKPDSTSSSSPAKSCAPGDDSPICEKPVSNSSRTTIPIVLGVVIPLTVALIILLVLHRRHVRKLRTEDAEDKHKSLDFGMGEVGPLGTKEGKRNKKGAQGIPEMSSAEVEHTLRHGRGMSMDLNMNHPYVLPPELQKSKESIHSMSRAMDNGDDKYRPATTFIPNDETSAGQGSRLRGGDGSSSHTNSTRPIFSAKENESHRSLLHNAQTISHSGPPTSRTSMASAGSLPAFHDPSQSGPLPRKSLSSESKDEDSIPSSSEPFRGLEAVDTSKGLSPNNLTGIDSYPSAATQYEDAVGVNSSASPPYSLEPAAHQTNMPLSPPVTVGSEPLKFDFPNFDEPSDDFPSSQLDNESMKNVVSSQDELHLPELQEGAQNFGYDVRRSTMGMRPLPLDDPSEDPEQRANRIRSFYKEYFDEAKPHQQNQRGLAYGGPFYGDPRGNPPSRHAPFAQPMARRAMTPPPRGASGFQAPGRQGPSTPGPHPANRNARAYSSGADRFTRPNGAYHRKKLPPPSPLPVLPTPHLLRDGSLLPIDFAPPSPFKERRAGTPDSVKGGLRPYSPGVAAHLPLASSFDDLTAMPSPHALRKSGSFTALDFAPPPRLRSSTDARSDAGSIRSNRSAMSTAQLRSIRAGAHRVSRIPQELGGTRQELVNTTLRPQWDMRK